MSPQWRLQHVPTVAKMSQFFIWLKWRSLETEPHRLPTTKWGHIHFIVARIWCRNRKRQTQTGDTTRAMLSKISVYNGKNRSTDLHTRTQSLWSSTLSNQITLKKNSRFLRSYCFFDFKKKRISLSSDLFSEFEYWIWKRQKSNKFFTCGTNRLPYH